MDYEDTVMAVQRMQEYIEKHLYDEITSADLSKASMYSPWYSCRIFLKHTTLTPGSYIRKLRLSASAIKLRDEKCKIADIAFECGFGSVDGYQRAFLKEFGCNPRQYAKNPVPIQLFIPYGVKFKHTEGRKIMENLRNVFISVIQKPKRKVLIRRGIKATDYMAYCNEVGCDIWGILKSIKSISPEPVCMWLTPEYIKKDTSQYVMGVEVEENYDDIIPEGFDIIDLPASKYLMFQGESFKEEDYCTAIAEVQESIKRYNPSALGMEWDNKNPQIQLEPIGERGYIELKAVK